MNKISGSHSSRSPFGLRYASGSAPCRIDIEPRGTLDTWGKESTWFRIQKWSFLQKMLIFFFQNAILGSMASRDYSYISPGPQEMTTFSATSARFRPNQGQISQPQNVPNPAPTRKTQQQNQQFETLPASVI